MLRSLRLPPLISRHGAGIRGENLVAITFRVLGQWLFHYLSRSPQNMPKGLLNTLVLPFLFPREHLPPSHLLFVWLGHEWKAEPCFGGNRVNYHTDVTSSSGLQAMTHKSSPSLYVPQDLCTYPEPENPSILVWEALVHQDLLQTLWVLGQGAQCCQEPAVSW